MENEGGEEVREGAQSRRMEEERRFKVRPQTIPKHQQQHIQVVPCSSISCSRHSSQNEVLPAMSRSQQVPPMA